MQKDLSVSQGSFRESVVQHTALAGVHTDGRAVPRVDGLDIARPHFVVVALPDVSSCSKDLFVSLRSVEHNAIWTIAELWAW